MHLCHHFFISLLDAKSSKSFVMQVDNGRSESFLMMKFDKDFCDLMAAGVDFTLRFEMHGNGGELLHARVYKDSFDRPSGVERRVEKNKRRPVFAD